jgi:RNA polymerase sigma factor (sigma-70 family)
MSSKYKQSDEIESLLRKPYLKSAEITRLATEYKNSKDENEKAKLKEKIFNNCSRMIQKSIIRICKGSYTQESQDIFNEATEGFCVALEKFDPKKKTMFTTYLQWLIDSHIYKYMESSGTIKISSNSQMFFRECAKLKDEWDKKKGNKGDLKDYIKKRLSKSYKFYSLDSLPDIDSALNKITSIQSYPTGNNAIDLSNPINEDKDIAMERDKFLKQIKRCLTPFEFEVIKIRYFSDDHELVKLHEIARVLGKSTAHVEQMEKRAIEKIRQNCDIPNFF